MEKMVEQLKDLKDLKDKYEGIIRRIEYIPKEIITIEKRMEERARDLEQILKDIENARKERQVLLVTGGKVNEVSARIKGLWEKCDLAEDEILGLKARARELRDEEVSILEDEKSATDEIIKVNLIPLVETYNRDAEALSNTLKEIFFLMDRWGMSFGDSKENGWGRFICPSSWRDLRVIPQLFWKGQIVGEDFVNFTKIYEKRSQEEAEKAFAKRIK